jgi:hypothetical protein
VSTLTRRVELLEAALGFGTCSLCGWPGPTRWAVNGDDREPFHQLLMLMYRADSDDRGQEDAERCRALVREGCPRCGIDAPAWALTENELAGLEQGIGEELRRLIGL